jgi:hypothetical protein
MTMKHFLAIFLLAACAATGYGQTIKTLGYNTTNGEVVYSGTNVLTFTNAPAFTDASTVRDNLGLGATNDVSFNSVSATEFKANTNFSALKIDDGADGFFKFVTTNTNDGALFLESYTNGSPHKSVILGVRGDDAFIQSASTNVRAETAFGALANLAAGTVSVTNAAVTRSNLGLGGGLTTNISIVGTNNTNTLMFSNGILTNVTDP